MTRQRLICALLATRLHQVALFTSFSTQTLERIWYTDSSDPTYFINGHLTVTARLSVAFALSAAMYICIMLIQGALSSMPEDTTVKKARDKVAAARRLRGQSTWARGIPVDRGESMPPPRMNASQPRLDTLEITTGGETM